MPAFALTRPVRLVVALLLMTAVLLGAAVTWAGAADAAVQPGRKDVTGSMRTGPGNFVTGFTLSADLPVSGSGPGLNLSPMCNDNQGTFTVTADPSKVTGFDLTGLSIYEPTPLSSFDFTVRGTTAGGGTVGTSFVNNRGTLTSGDYSSFTGLTSFRVTITDTELRGYICTQAFDAFTIANPVGPADLSSLALSAGTLSPTFDSATTGYSATVPFTTTSLTVTPTVRASTATVTVNGVPVTSGSPTGSIALVVGSNTVTTVVTAQNGATEQYTTTVTRAAGSANADLSALSLSAGTLSPVFAAGTTSYTAGVPNGTTSITVTPTVADAQASVTVNGVATASGNASGAIALAVGANTITTVVTAQDGVTSTTYSVAVTRAGVAPVFTDTGLGALQVGVAVTDGVQATGTPTITYAVTAGALPAGLALDAATGAVTGIPTAAGPFTTEITASSTWGTTSTAVTGTVQAATTPVVLVTDPPTSGAAAAGETVGFTGAGLAPGSTVVVTLYSTPVQLYSGTVGADGTTAPTVTIPAGIPAGAHRIETVVTAPGGTTATATVWFTVRADGTTGAVSLAGPVTDDAPVTPNNPVTPNTPVAPPRVAGAAALATTGSPVAVLAGIAVLLLVAGSLTLAAARNTRDEDAELIGAMSPSSS